MVLDAVRELLFNVVKHSGVKNAIVTLGTNARGRIEVTVSDRGAGFDPAKAHEYGKTSGGIGLFSLRERLALVGGGMSFESAPGHGATFTMWTGESPEPTPDSLPGEPESRPPLGSRQSPVDSEQAGSRGIRVLLIDDHQVVRKGIALQLSEQAGIRVVGEASDAESGIRLIRELSPDVVTMDVTMPGMSGIEATRLVRAEFPSVAVIGLSMFDEPNLAKAMKDAGAAEHISKSATIERLVAAIRAAIEKPSSPLRPPSHA